MTRDPADLSPDERRRELADLFAAALIVLRDRAALPLPGPARKPANSDQNQLDSSAGASVTGPAG